MVILIGVVARWVKQDGKGVAVVVVVGAVDLSL